MKISIGKLQRCLSLTKCAASPDELADDVKAGHFTVFAVKGGVPKRFVVELGCLADPSFLCLLEQAKDEYGFKQKGPLVVPCRPEELQKILLRRSGAPTCRTAATDRRG